MNSLLPSTCPHCGAHRFTNSQVFRCGYVEGHVPTEICIKRNQQQDERVDDEIARRQMVRHFGEDE